MESSFVKLLLRLLHDRGGAKKITRDWALSLLRRIKYVKRKDTRKAKKSKVMNRLLLKNLFQIIPNQSSSTGEQATIEMISCSFKCCVLFQVKAN